MHNNDVPAEYMHCFKITDDITERTPMEVEEAPLDLYEATILEWYEWQPGQNEKKPVKEPMPDVIKLLDLDSYQDFQKESQRAVEQISQGPIAANKQAIERNSKIVSRNMPTQKARGPYRSYLNLQVQELLDLVMEQGVVYKVIKDNIYKNKMDQT